MNFAHIGFAVRDIKKSKEFYSAALAPLGLLLEKEKTDSLHFGKGDGKTMLWIHTRGQITSPFHFSFEADNRTQVQEFYNAALAAGGTDNGAPGVRENYSANYYATFVLDPDGHNLEVVYREENSGADALANEAMDRGA
jgi:catechol 2,3-dioxygenase-like lactoylglutathione lyase family enzyme